MVALAAQRSVCRAGPAAWLTRIISRLCLDLMKSARARREIYPGTWLPETLIEAEDDAFRPDSLTLTLMMMALERLSPLERAAFLLHDVFVQSMNKVATIIERSPAATRKLATRARAHVQIDRPRYTMSKDDAETFTRAFFEARISGDAAALGCILAEEVTFQSDGGGKIASCPKVIFGAENLIRLFQGGSRKFGYRMELVEPCCSMACRVL